MEAHVLGFPRIGAGRELKKALENFWKGTGHQDELMRTAKTLKERNWKIQRDQGLSMVAVGDFSLYDQMLDTAFMLGMIPQRFGAAEEADLSTYFRMARGDATANLPAMEMTKWFDTNYHYLVPEFTPQTIIRRSTGKLIEETCHALSLGFRPKPVLIGPLTFTSLAKELNGADRWRFLDDIVRVYCTLLVDLAPLCDWIQIDEPILCTDLPGIAREAFVPALRRLKEAAAGSQLLLATYFGALGDNLPLALESGCDGLHLDLVRGAAQLNTVLDILPETMVLSAGLVNGRNVWKNDLRHSKQRLDFLAQRLGEGRVMAASSCSLLHVPVDLWLEKNIDPTIREWLAFAVQKCRETATLAKIAGGCHEPLLRENDAQLAARRSDSRTLRPEVRSRVAGVTEAMQSRTSIFPQRKKKQAAWLKLPLLPTTTIGSFPQTAEIRSIRRQFAAGAMPEARYKAFIRRQIRQVVEEQEKLGLDVLVHGEPERNDMVEYFGQHLEGFYFTENGWVQSYGSRCVKPPIIYGDVARPAPITIDWIRYAQSLTTKPVKGMLTGPVTILCWSFVRDDLSRAEVCQQIALAMRDEVLDLEKARVGIIQIDEAALREGMPLRRREVEAYLRWAVDCFRLTAAGVGDETQIHTHMCYSEFNSIIPWITAMDADVISIEASRSDMKLLRAFQRFDYPNDIGPGIYDIHSPRVPSVAEMVALIRQALEVVPAQRLWINPDCGLKTRQWPETLAALRNLVEAAGLVRSDMVVNSARAD
ncbi:5-methyltetrahydropteroyltriglutamate--homocysteine S-methyltransferase [Desulfuromonas thiophila]|uniref:5-methyltetrahydropteroyltriglutamate-- homocysteine S-methyltransferase n=1 Tax=Desulfuromonas thiophila TaxID=57664 RepID=UPI0029F46E0A|nr:5-methyltetrahydropteroyltriglutamate--homocysteine S-methyltransferase [Desulfuromonas thiophila]